MFVPTSLSRQDVCALISSSLRGTTTRARAAADVGHGRRRVSASSQLRHTPSVAEPATCACGGVRDLGPQCEARGYMLQAIEICDLLVSGCGV
jgi:hypothetical protein